MIVSLALGKATSTATEVKKFISAGSGQPSPWALLRNQIYLGSEQFVEQMRSLINENKELIEVPASYRRPAPKGLDDYKTASPDRSAAILSAYLSAGFTLKEIGALHHGERDC